MTNNLKYHIPVLLKQSVDALSFSPNALVVDATFGGGGHSVYMLSKLGSDGKLFAVDQDHEALDNILDAPQFNFIQGNFRFLKNHLALKGIRKVDAILADIGVSSHQFDAQDRGFSLRQNAKLDMRMNQKSDLSAAQVLNGYSESELLRIFNEFSDLTSVFKLVQNILAYRSIKPFEYTDQLVELGLKTAPRGKDHKYLAQVFQAIRIEVNQELEALKALLTDAETLLNKGGRIAVISYHSIEDRIVKNYFKRGAFDGQITKDFFGNILKPFEEINRHPITPDEQEINENPRSRSAKLRIAVKS